MEREEDAEEEEKKEQTGEKSKKPKKKMNEKPMRPRRSARHRCVIKGADETQPAPRQYVFVFNMLTVGFNDKSDFKVKNMPFSFIFGKCSTTVPGPVNNYATTDQ